jgi:D-3-phosphoglycerate dehydrogenase / 2-oxoglutarate reductase
VPEFRVVVLRKCKVIARYVLGAGIVVHDPHVEQASERLAGFEELLSTADIVCVHCPLTRKTQGLINAAALARLKPTAILVNTSRGPIVELEDVLTALRLGRLGGAALDVFPTEPPDSERLAGVPNLLVTPHSAFYSREAIKESQHKAATQVLKALRGEPLDYPCR